MNIGIVTTWFERGAAYVSRQYRDSLNRAGHKTFIYARGEEYPINDPLWDDSSVTWSYPRTYPDSSQVHLKKFKRWIVEKKLDIVFFNEQRWWPALLVAKKLGVKTVGYIDYYTETTVPYFALYDALICNTKRHYSVFSWHKQCLYLPWGTNVQLFKPQEKPPQLQNKGVIFMHSAGVSPERKGTDLAIKAFSLLTGSCHLFVHVQWDLSIYTEELGETIETLQAKGKLTLHKEEVNAPGLYHYGDIYVYPSRLDGIGLSQAEALSCGLPIIVPDNPPMNEFVTEKSGMVVPIEKLWSRSDGYYWPMCEVDLKKLADAMQSIVNNAAQLPLKKEQAREYALSHLDWTTRDKPLNTFFDSISVLPIEKDLEKTITQNYPNDVQILVRGLKRRIKKWLLPCQR